jgi:hypothetical protein
MVAASNVIANLTQEYLLSTARVSTINQTMNNRGKL